MRTHLWRGLKNLEDAGDACCSDPERGRLTLEWESIFSICFEVHSTRHENNRTYSAQERSLVLLGCGLWDDEGKKHCLPPTETVQLLDLAYQV